MALWTPSRLAPALKGWWYAPDVNQADGTAVASWNDKSGNGNHLVQATGGGVQPTYETNVLNGRPVVQFASASSQRLEIASTFGITAAPISIYALWQAANSTNQVLIHLETGGATDPAVFIDATGGGQLDTRGSTSIDLAITKAAPRMTGGVINGASSAAAIDGGTRTTGNCGTANLNGTQTTVGCALGESTLFLNGFIYTLLVFNTAVSQDDEDKIFGWMAWDSGLEANLASGHPYEDEAPTVPNVKSGLRYPLGTGLRNRSVAL